ncbi:Uncharacterised protein [Serratia grimesii]|uniref:HNH endonuclease signature motif containing protein n=1 Tax=Serratia grimesii TaxID=82995 RepID=UPI00217C5D0A|nr:HNH endonuclease signature motif containing protein [Serratia grimesii]CAI1721954.1 Uncharacterised protein [Serratia grimesii]
MKNSVLADALVNAINQEGGNNSLAKLINKNKAEKDEIERRKALAHTMSIGELLKVKSEYALILKDKGTSLGKRNIASNIIKLLDFEISKRNKNMPVVSYLRENRLETVKILGKKEYKRAYRKAYIESIDARSFKRTKPPELLPEKKSSEKPFLLLTEQAIERDRRRKELIEKEAKAETERMAAISRISSTMSRKELSEEILLSPKSKDSTVLLKKTNKPIGNEDEIYYFNRSVYLELIKSLPTSEAFKIARNKELSKKYHYDSISLGNYTYFNSLAYYLALRKLSTDSSLSIAKEQRASEVFLYNFTGNNYRNKIQSLPERKIKICSSPSFIQSVDIKMISTNVEKIVSIRRISDQQSFKKRVTLNFKGKCAITGQAVSSILQACHIEEYSKSKNMDTSNGILLTADCHQMFDNLILGINPDDLTIHFNVDCVYSRLFEGKRLGEHTIGLDKEKIRKKWSSFIHNRNLLRGEKN